MLTLTLLRHAKSSWDEPDLDDHERPLSKRGAKAATLVGRFIAASSPPVDRVLCSDAVRARATLTLVLAELPNPLPKVTYERKLYLATPQGYLAQVSSCTSHQCHVMVVGHNPDLQMLALELVRDGNHKGMAAMTRKFPTAALAMIEFDTDDWREITQVRGSLRSFTIPKDLA